MADKQARSGQVPLAGKSESFGGHRIDDGKKFRVDPDLEWLVLEGGAAMGERGTLAGVVSVLELGGGDHGGVPNTDLYSDKQIGWGSTVVGHVERHRWLSTAWEALDREDRAILLSCCMPPPAAMRDDEGFGARDACPPVEAIQRGTTEPHAGRHKAVHTGVTATLGNLASTAFLLITGPEERVAKECSKLLEACKAPKKSGNPTFIKATIEKARLAAESAHGRWLESKAGADKPRRSADRRGVPTWYDAAANREEQS
jgi:hypothetical protein